MKIYFKKVISEIKSKNIFEKITSFFLLDNSRYFKFGNSNLKLFSALIYTSNNLRFFILFKIIGLSQFSNISSIKLIFFIFCKNKDSKFLNADIGILISSNLDIDKWIILSKIFDVKSI